MTKYKKRAICSTCFHSVNESEATCPSCGAKNNSSENSHFGQWARWGFWVFNIAMAIWFWAQVRPKAVGSANSLQWFEMDAGKFIVLWLLGATLLGVIALKSRPK